MSAFDDAGNKLIADAELIHQLLHNTGTVDIGEGQTRSTFAKIVADFNATNAVSIANKAESNGSNATGVWPIEAATVTNITEAQVLGALGMTPISVDEIGASGGICELDSNQLVPAIRLPSYVDDVVEVATFGDLPVTGASGKLYIVVTDTDTNTNQYRWSGTVYIKLVASPGTTDDVVEGTAKYFTAARALAVALSGLSLSDGSAITAADSILASIGKLQKQINTMPYDLAGSIYGKPTSLNVVHRFETVRAFTIPQNMSGSVAKCAVAATAITVLTLAKDGVNFGTITFAADGTTGVFAAATATVFTPGNQLTVTAAEVADLTFADCSFTIAAALS